MKNNYCFIDGQNLILWISYLWLYWIDYKKLKIYLKNKYQIDKIFYFLWFPIEENKKIYKIIEESWFEIIFKKQKEKNISQKKWNIDSDMIFYTMKKWWLEKDLWKIFLISWDWDFKILADFLIEQWKFWKIIFPSKKWRSSLYKKLDIKYTDFLSNFKHEILYIKKDKVLKH